MFVKRLFDFSFALLGSLFLLPLMLLLAIIIKVEMPGPVFFFQKRVGHHGKLFTMIKLRTMTINHGGSTISIKGESRITPLGAFLRKYKLDELPELWNIVKGDMSFVGPRPDVPGYADQLSGDDRILLSIAPGLTGPASLKYANEEELLSKQSDPVLFNDTVIYPDKVKINLAYIKNWSLKLDLKIIFYTVLNKKLKEPWAQ